MRNTRLRHSQSESWRRIGKYVAKPAFFARTSGLQLLTLSLTLNVEPGTCERLRISFGQGLGPSRSLILSSGCSVPAMTPQENIEAMVRVARDSL